MNLRLPIATAIALLLVAFAFGSGAAEFNPARTRPVQSEEPQAQRVIVKLRSTTAAQSAVTARALAGRARVELTATRYLGRGLQLMKVAAEPDGESIDELLSRLRADPDVQYAVADRRVYAHAVSNDPLAVGQWYLAGAQSSAIDAQRAWDTTLGSRGVVIAVLDTGVLFDHPDLGRAGSGGRMLPGYDFVSANGNGGFFRANDGDGRDPDPSDPGDWVTQNEQSSTCDEVSDSSWHGTRVAGIIGALTDNLLGIAGIDRNAWILPVRVLGKCGGFNSDILAGMLWAGGESVDGVPPNPYPARILNLSLGSLGSCDRASADVVNTLVARGVLVVVSAGNEGGPVDSPANCPGAAAIAGMRHAGTKVGFSNLGREIALGAPGGNCVNIDGGPCLFSIDTTSNDGATVPRNHTFTNQINFNVGTSFAAPIVSGIAGLMLAVNGNLNSAQLIARLKEGASKPFPTISDTGAPPVCHVPSGPTDLQAAECACTTETCGAGLANAAGSVNAALRPIVAITVSSPITPGGNVTLRGGGSGAACGRRIDRYEWRVISSDGVPPPILGDDTATATVVAPSIGSATIRLTVTDDAGRADAAEVVLRSNSASTGAPAQAGNTACLAAVVPPSLRPEINVTAADATAAESAADPGTFTLSRNGDFSAVMAVTVALAGSATSGADYQAIDTTVNFAAGSSTASVAVAPLDDTAVEGTESVTLTLVEAAAYIVGSSRSATVNIIDNDTAPPAPPSGGGGGGGGGGSTDLLLLAAVALALARVRNRCGAQERTRTSTVLPAST